MTASVTRLPTAAREPVKQHKRVGRFPKMVTSLYLERNAREHEARQAEGRRAAQCVAEEDEHDDGIVIARMCGELIGLYNLHLPAQRQESLLRRVRELLVEFRS